MILTEGGVCFNETENADVAFGPDFSPNHDPHQARKLPLFSKINSSIVFCTVLLQELYRKFRVMF